MLKSVVPVGARRVMRAFRFAPRAASRLASSRLSIFPDPYGASAAGLRRSAHPRNQMQRGPSFIGRIRIGASIQQIGRQLVVVASDREQQRAGASRWTAPPAPPPLPGRPAPFQALIHVGSRIEQHASDIHSTVARRKKQCRPSLSRSRLDIGPTREKRLDGLEMPFTRRPHQRRLAAVRSFDVRVGSMGEEHLDGGAQCRSAPQPSNCLAFRRCRVWICAGL